MAACHLDFGRLYRSTGKVEPAEACLVTALAMFTEMDIPRGLAAVETELRLLEGVART